MHFSFSPSCGVEGGAAAAPAPAPHHVSSDDRDVRHGPPLRRPRESPAEERLADLLGQVARSFQAQPDTQELLAEIATAAVWLVPGAQDASISMVVGTQVASTYATSDFAGAVDRFQTEIGEGPRLDALHQQKESVHVSDLADERRWPTLTRYAHQLGVRSMLATRLSGHGRTLGALTLLSGLPRAFDDEAHQTNLLLASHAGVALATAVKSDQLHRAIDSRDLIGQAKGILIQRYRLDHDRASDILTKISQTTHRKLSDIAHELVTTGRLDDLEPQPVAARSRSTNSLTPQQ